MSSHNCHNCHHHSPLIGQSLWGYQNSLLQLHLHLQLQAEAESGSLYT